MTKEEAQGYCELIMALAEGKEVEIKMGSGELDERTVINTLIPFKNYRIKPQQKNVPFDLSDAEKLIGKSIKPKDNDRNIMMITGCSNTHIYINGNGVLYEGLFSGWEFLDGSPCGKEVTL